MLWLFLWIFSVCMLYTLRRVWWLSPSQCIVTHFPSKRQPGQGRVLSGGVYVLYPVVEKAHTICWSSCTRLGQGWTYEKKACSVIDLRSREYVPAARVCVSSDGVPLKLQLSILYHVELQQVQLALQHSDPVQLLSHAACQMVGEYVLSHTAEEVLQHWSELASLLLQKLRKRTDRKQLGLSVDQVSMLSIDYYYAGGDEEGRKRVSLHQQLQQLLQLKKKYSQCSDVALAILLSSDCSSSLPSLPSSVTYAASSSSSSSSSESGSDTEEE